MVTIWEECGCEDDQNTFFTKANISIKNKTEEIYYHFFSSNGHSEGSIGSQ